MQTRVTAARPSIFLDSSPVHPLVEPDAPAVLRTARLVRFATIRFVTVTRIDLAGLVPIAIDEPAPSAGSSSQ